MSLIAVEAAITLHPLVHGVTWSLMLNVLAYIGFSLRWQPTSIERMQAELFVPSHLAPTPSFRLWRSSVTVEELIAGYPDGGAYFVERLAADVLAHA